VKKAKVFVIIIPLATTIGLIWSFTNSYDFAPSTKENPFGVEARLVYEHNMRISCPIEPCGPLNAFVLKHNSREPVQFVAFNICGGIFCIKQEGFGGHGPPAPELASQPEKWGGGTVGQIPWSIGDVVDIRVKVKPAHILEDGKVVFDEKIWFIDLGESKIIEVENE